MHPPGNIFLVGLMGAGKTTIGRQLAAHFGLDFVDSDHEIERRCGVKIPVIFEIEGEEGFRRREAQVIAELTQASGCVVATGGGAVLLAENRAALHERGIVVYLEADADTLFERTRRDRGRPLLQTADPRGRIHELLAVRAPLYREVAHLIVPTDQRPPALVARDIGRRIEQWQRQHEDTHG